MGYGRDEELGYEPKPELSNEAKTACKFFDMDYDDWFEESGYERKRLIRLSKRFNS